MKRLLLSLALIASSLSAITLDEVIEKSLQKSPSLEVIQAKLKANKSAVDISNQFANPEILITSNSLDNSEKMSQTVLTLKQKIYYYDKRNSNQKVALAQERVIQEELRSAKVALVERIKNEAYTIWELRATRSILEEYAVLTQKNIELFEAYTSVSTDQHMGIMKAELSLSDLKIKISTIDAQILAADARLSYLSAFEVKDLEINLTINKKPDLNALRTNLQNNPELALKEQEIQKQNASLEVADLNNYPDMNLLVGYAYRENFDNYFNVGIALSLPIYGTEDAQEEQQRANTLGSISQKEDVFISLDATLKAYYAQMLSSYEIYHIVEDEALPQVAHMFEISNASISTGSDLFKYIDVLFDKLALEQNSITAVANFYKASAQLSKLSGDLK